MALEESQDEVSTLSHTKMILILALAGCVVMF